MALAGEMKSPAELGELLGDVPQASLYRHLHRLVAGGVLEVAGERRSRSAVERLYTLKPGAAYLSQGDARQISREEHLRGFTSYLLALLEDYARFLREADLPGDLSRVGFQKLPFNASDEEFQAFSRQLNESLLPHLSHQPAPGRRRQILALVTLPETVHHQGSAKSEVEPDESSRRGR